LPVATAYEKKGRAAAWVEKEPDGSCAILWVVPETSIGRICLVVGAADVFGIIGVSETNIASLYDIIVGREEVETGRNSA
jgi:ABC-type uncharacterized transport system ATPase subunit